MVRPLFHSMSEKLTCDYDKGVFYPFRTGWLLPIRDLKNGEVVSLGQQFLNSFLCGRFVSVENEKEPCGYYFTSQFKVATTGTFLLGYSPAKSGTARHSSKVFADDNLVIVEYPNCGTLAVNPQTNEGITYILEGQ